MDILLRRAEQAYNNEPSLASFENYRMARRRGGNPISPDVCGRIYSKLIGQVLSNDVVVFFDEGNWSSYSPQDQHNVWLEIFWDDTVFCYLTLNHNAGPEDLQYLPLNRDIIALTVDTQNNIYDLQPDLRYQDELPHVIEPETPNWVLQQESSIWTSLRVLLASTPTLLPGQIQWS